MPTTLPAHSEQTLYLLDISSFIFRAFFAIRSLSNAKGEPTNAVYGVASMVQRLLAEAHPRFLVVAYDSPEPTFREEMYAEYKANRSDPPEDLLPQFARIDQLIRLMRVPSFRKGGAEADDLIATLAREWLAASPEHRVVIVTGDKDLMQLVDPSGRAVVWDTMSGKVFGPAEVEEKFGLPPTLVRDYLGLVGDSSDNIPGVDGIGPKGAVDLLKAYGSLEGVLQAAQEGKISGKKGQTLVAQAEIARLSAKLASLDDHVEGVTALPVALSYQFRMSPELRSLLEELDFQSLIPKWEQAEEHHARARAQIESGEKPVSAAEFAAEAAPTQSGPRALPEGIVFDTITTEAQFVSLLDELRSAPEFGFDVETTSVNPREAELVGIALCPGATRAVYIPVGHRGTGVEQLPLARVLDGLRPLLVDPRHKKIGQNLKYDFAVLARYGIEADGIGADTMVASYVLDPEGRHNLETIAQKYLGYTVLTYEQVCGSGKKQIGFDLVPVELATRYSAEDAWVACRLWETLRDRIQAEGLMDVFAEVDLPLVPVLERMERTGVCIDEDYLQQLSREFDKELREIEAKVQVYCKGPINLNSPKQIAQLLFEELKLPPQGKTKTGYSTDASVLEALAQLHEVPALLLEYREISKLKGTYVDPLPTLRDPRDGKIHTSFHQASTATGRLSCSDPNLQNIPIRTDRGQRIRRAFIPSLGNVLLSADYSQIELRLLAHMSGDKELVRSFNADEDVHARTASEIFGVPLEQVDSRQRGIAKAINFGLMYGKTPFGLAQELKISRREAQDVIDRYFQRYHGVKIFLDRQIADARTRGYSTTLLGRKRPLPLLKSSNAALRANAERMAMNAPIQGTAADLMKLAMTRLDHELREKGFRSKLTIQVHDEVVLDCPRDEAEAVKKLTVEVLETALRLDVPLRVNAAVGDNWMEL